MQNFVEDKKLFKELFNQVRAELGDDEVFQDALRFGLPNATVLALKQKYGMVPLPELHIIAREAKKAHQ